MNLAQIITRT